MPEELQNLRIVVKVDKDTGNLEIVDAQLGKTTEHLKNIDSNSKKFNFSWRNMLIAIGLGQFAFTSINDAIATFSNWIRTGIKDAYDDIVAMKQLKFAVEGTGASWDKTSKQLNDYFRTISQVTRFTQSDTLKAYQTLLKYTGDINSSQRLLNIAMNTSVVTQKDLGEITRMIGLALQSPTRGYLMLRREFGSFVGDSKDVVTQLKELERRTKDVAISTDDLVERTMKTRKKWRETWESYGKIFLEFWDRITETIVNFPINIEKMLASMSAIFKAGFKGLAFDTANFERLQKEAYEKINKKYAELEDKKRVETKKTMDASIDATIETADEDNKSWENKLKLIQKLSSDFTGIFADTMTQMIGEGTTFETAISGMFERVKVAFVNALATMVAEYIARRAIIGLLGGIFGVPATALSGLMGGMQTGGIVPRTAPYLLHQGERVIPSGSQPSIAGGIRPSVVVNLNLSPLDIRSVEQRHIDRLVQQIVPIINREMKR